MNAQKEALLKIAGTKLTPQVDARKLLAGLIAIAIAAVESKNMKGEAAKQAKDRERAEASIAILEGVLANPQRLRVTVAHDNYKNDTFLPAVEMELNRMRAAVTNPDALRNIYRKNERR